MLKFVGPRGGAAFGGILAAFDTGIGTGSIAVGWMAQHVGLRAAFGVGAVLSAFSIPYSSAARSASSWDGSALRLHRVRTVAFRQILRRGQWSRPLDLVHGLERHGSSKPFMYEAATLPVSDRASEQ